MYHYKFLYRNKDRVVYESNLQVSHKLMVCNLQEAWEFLRRFNPGTVFESASVREPEQSSYSVLIWNPK